MKLDSGDVFLVVRNAQKAGLLELWPGLTGRIAPGERFFESVQRDLLDNYDMEKLDQVLYNLAPAIHYMAEQQHWEPAEFTAEELFQAVKNLQTMGAFEVKTARTLGLPGAGDRFFEYYQNLLVHKLGVDVLDRILHTLGQCIRFLATDAALENVKSVAVAAAS